MAKQQYINFDWSFFPGYEESYLDSMPPQAIKVDLPHNVKALPYHYFDEGEYQGLFTYEKIFDDENPCFPVKFLHFDGVMLQMQVYLNGMNLGHFVSGYLPVDIDVSKLIKEKGNRLLVIVDSREDKSIPPFGDLVDYMTFGGIYRKVSLISHPSSYVSSLFIKADMDGHLEVKTSLANPNPELKVSHILYRGDKVEAEFLGEVLDLSSPHLWTLDDPYLYTLKTIYGDDERIDNVGFRSAVFTPEGFFLNRVKTKIIGVNRHQTYPYFGAAAPDSLQRDDANIIKFGLGANLVRTSHYSDDESFLDQCDRIGLLLVDEVPGWQHIGTEKKWRAQLRDFCYRMILKERNHPCLVAYGLRVDESKDDHELYSSLQQIKKDLDPSRQSLGVRCFKHSELLEDVYAYNDFVCAGLSKGLDDPKTYVKGKHPVLVSENMGHTFPTKQADTNAKRLEHALRHARVLDDSFSHPNLCGSVAWCAFDYNTHKDFGSGDRICYHGLSDIFRLPKYAAFLYASQTLPNTFFVAGNLDLGEEDGSYLRFPYVFTDADYVELYHGDKFVGRYYPDREEFPHLPHPPVKVDDLLGASVLSLGFTEKEASALRGPVMKYACKGPASLSLSEKLTLYRIVKRHFASFEEGAAKIQDLMLGRGEKERPFLFRGYKNKTLFAEKAVCMSRSWHYELSSSASSLKNGASYDALRVSIRKVDQNGTPMAQGNDVLLLEAEGPIQIMGPSRVALVGGGISVYLRSLRVEEKQKAALKIYAPDQELSFDLEVE
mgnify:FL=1